MILVMTVVRGEKGREQKSQGSLPSFYFEITGRNILIRGCLISTHIRYIMVHI